MNINTYGVLNLTKAFLPILLERPSANIVNVSSMGGFLPVPGQGIYGVSKAAVKLFTEALYAETIGTNVNVSVVFPGAVATNITSNRNKITSTKNDGNITESSDSQSKTTPPDKAARIIIKGMQKNKFRIFVGRDAKIMDILYRLMPKKAINMMYNMLKKMGVMVD